jgi:hypothetical protein
MFGTGQDHIIKHIRKKHWDKQKQWLVYRLYRLYDAVFKTYPTPMNNAEYIKKVIQNNKTFLKLEDMNILIKRI